MPRVMLLLMLCLAFGCGEKFTAPDPSGSEGGSSAIDDTTYIQLRPAWDNENGYDFSRPQDVLIGNETLVYVADTGNDRVTMLDLAGNVLGHSAYIDSPVGLAQDVLLRLLVVSGKNYLFRIDLAVASHYIGDARVETLYHAVDRPGWHFNGVEAYDIASEGGIYYLVTCSGDARNDNLILFIEEDGYARGPLNLTPNGTGLFAAADPSGIVALDSWSVDFAFCQRGENYYKVQTVTTDAYGWAPGLDPSTGEDLFTLGKFASPEDVAVNGDGFLFVVDSDLNRLFKFSGMGKEFESFGEEGSGERQFREPHGIAEFDRTVYVADTGNDRVVRFRLSTELK